MVGTIVQQSIEPCVAAIKQMYGESDKDYFERILALLKDVPLPDNPLTIFSEENICRPNQILRILFEDYPQKYGLSPIEAWDLATTFSSKIAILHTLAHATSTNNIESFKYNLLIKHPELLKGFLNIFDSRMMYKSLQTSDKDSIEGFYHSFHRDSQEALATLELQSIETRLSLLSNKKSPTFEAEKIKFFREEIAPLPLTKEAKALRAEFYQNVMTDVPAALQNYHTKRLERVKRRIERIFDPLELLTLVKGIAAWDETPPSKRKKLAVPLSRIIARAYRIRAPKLDALTEPKKELNEKWSGKYRFFTREKASNGVLRGTMFFRCPEEISSFLEAVFHEVGGHAVENNLGMRVCGFDQRNRSLDPKTPLGQSALMLTFNNAEYVDGHYFPSNEGRASYEAQISEKTAFFVQDLSYKNATSPLLELVWIYKQFDTNQEDLKRFLISQCEFFRDLYVRLLRSGENHENVWEYYRNLAGILEDKDMQVASSESWKILIEAVEFIRPYAETLSIPEQTIDDCSKTIENSYKFYEPVLLLLEKVEKKQANKKQQRPKARSCSRINLEFDFLIPDVA